MKRMKPELTSEDAAAGAVEQEEINAEERATSLEERESRVARREAAADARNALADERDRAAEERERIGDERERLADMRERHADEREALADEREQRLNELEAKVDARARNFGVPTEGVPDRVLETIARGRVLLAASSASLDRSQAAVERQRERNSRHQHAIDRETAATDRDDSAPMEPDAEVVRGAGDRGEYLRQRFLAAAADFVRVEENVADFYERSGAADPQRQARHIQIAHDARETARQARLAATQIAGEDVEPSS